MIRLSQERDMSSLGATPALRLERVVYLCDVDKSFGMNEARSVITQLLDAPRTTGASVPAGSGDTSRVPTARVGVYRLNGRLYVVRKAKTSDRIYALELVSAPDRVMEDGSVAKLELEYRKGMIFELRDEHRLPAIEVEQVSRQYGRCIQCGLKLKAAKSVQRGIGPVCWKKVS
jgi:Family of unknown function (DUF6011)